MSAPGLPKKVSCLVWPWKTAIAGLGLEGRAQLDHELGEIRAVPGAGELPIDVQAVVVHGGGGVGQGGDEGGAIGGARGRPELAFQVQTGQVGAADGQHGARVVLVGP
jgi:hypothetical protein